MDQRGQCIAGYRHPMGGQTNNQLVTMSKMSNEAIKQANARLEAFGPARYRLSLGDTVLHETFRDELPQAWEMFHPAYNPGYWGSHDNIHVVLTRIGNDGVERWANLNLEERDESDREARLLWDEEE